jgi:uncharacterized FlaG/YvyC family protein
MGIGPVHRIDVGAAAAAKPEEVTVTFPEIVMAVRNLNESAMLGEQRELRHRRQSKGRVVIELVDSETGEVLGELPPGDVVQMAAQLHREEEDDDNKDR